MKKNIEWLLNPPLTGSLSFLLLRILVGSIFFWEGVLKFVYTNQGVGRFTKISNRRTFTTLQGHSSILPTP